TDRLFGPGVYTYRTLFDLCGFDSTSAQITGRWAADDSGIDIILNGQSAGKTSAGPGILSGFFTLSAGAFTFNESVNTLDFVTTNGIPSTVGLRTELTMAVAPLATATITNSIGLINLTGIT